MLITPRFGSDRANMLQQLVEVEASLKNVRGRGLTAVDLFYEYLRWANEAVRMLRHQAQERDIERLVLTRRYWTVQAMATEPVGMARELVEVEIDDRTTFFEEAIRTTRTEFARWDQYGRLVVADTSFFHQHPEKLDMVDSRRCSAVERHRSVWWCPWSSSTSSRTRSGIRTTTSAGALK